MEEGPLKDLGSIWSLWHNQPSKIFYRDRVTKPTFMKYPAFRRGERLPQRKSAPRRHRRTPAYGPSDQYGPAVPWTNAVLSRRPFGPIRFRPAAPLNPIRFRLVDSLTDTVLRRFYAIEPLSQ